MHTLGWAAVGWIEHYLRHGPGDVQGQRIKLTDEECAFLVRAYRLQARPVCVECGQRTERTVLDEQEADGRPWECRHCRERLEVRRAAQRYMLSRPKGWSKSGRAGEVACFDALGPSRFDGWSSSGEPVGAAVTAPEVLCLATEETQSGHTYDVIRMNLARASCSDEILDDYPGIDAGLTRILLPDGGEVTPVTSGASSKDGGRSSLAVVDEPHLWWTPELIRLFDTVRRNNGKRRAADPWLLATTTMFRPAQNSVAETLWDEANRPSAPESLVLDHRESPVALRDALELAEKEGDDAPLIAALEAAYGDAAERMDFERIIAEELRSVSVDPDDAERFWFNRRVQHRSVWLDPEHVQAVTVDDELKPSDRVVLAFDGSEGTLGDSGRRADSTVLRACRVSDGLLATVGMWEHPEGVSQWEPPRLEVDQVVRDAFDLFTVERMYVDPPGWRSEQESWAAEFGDDRVAQFWTLNDGRMGGALDRLRTAIRAAARLPDPDTWQVRFHADRRAAAHYSNARTFVKRRTQRSDPDAKKELTLVRKEHPNSNLKIDTVVADAMAFEARAHVLMAKPVDDGPADGAELVMW